MKFSERLSALGFANYEAYLRSAHWTEFKRKWRAGGNSMKCQVCGKGPIQLHHRTYLRLGQERMTDVVPLCRAHHVAVHEWLESSGKKWVHFTDLAVAFLSGIPSKRRKKKSKPKKRKVTDPLAMELSQQIGAEKAAEKKKPLQQPAYYLEILATLSLTANQKAQVEKHRGDPIILRGYLFSFGLNSYPPSRKEKLRRRKRPHDFSEEKSCQNFLAKAVLFASLRGRGLTHYLVPPDYSPTYETRHLLFRYIDKLYEGVNL